MALSFTNVVDYWQVFSTDSAFQKVSCRSKYGTIFLITTVQKAKLPMCVIHTTSGETTVGLILDSDLQGIEQVVTRSQEDT